MSSLTVVTATDLVAANKVYSEVPPGNFTCPKCGEGKGILYSYKYDSLTCRCCGKEAHVSEFNLAPPRESFENYEERRIDDVAERVGIDTGSPTYRRRLQHPTHQEQVRLKELGSGND